MQLAMIGGMLYFVNYGNAPHQGIALLGLACILLNITTIGAPLFAIQEVLLVSMKEMFRWCAVRLPKVCPCHTVWPASS